MAVHDDLGTRMKTYYEAVPKHRLIRRMPVAIRIDGKAFHTFTKGFQRPFDEVLGNAMVKTMEYLAKNIQGCVFAYQQSDEITLILIDYQTLDTDAWFDYEIQKICSISASMATMAFNKFFNEEVNNWYYTCPVNISKDDLFHTYVNSIKKGAMFDARCFNIPKEEVTNLVYWRQLDATRNSIQMVGQHYFSHSELQGMSCNMIQDMLHVQKAINWNNYETRWKRGVCCHKVPSERIIDTIVEEREWGDPLTYEKVIQKYEWEIDWNMPQLKGENREYLDKLIFVGE